MTDKVNAACGREGALGHKEFVAGKGTNKGEVEFMNNAGVRPESCTLSELVKGQSAEAKACRQ